MATKETVGRGRGRGGRVPASTRGRSHLRGPRHVGRDLGCHQELSTLERTAHKFCHGLYGRMRRELVHGAGAELSSVADVGVLEWLVVTMHDDHDPPQRDENATWRHIREKLEAVSVLSVLACTTSYAWRRNEPFWRRFTQSQHDRPPLQRDNRGLRHLEPRDVGSSIRPAPRDDVDLPRFLLDFSFVEITSDVVTLLRHTLWGSEKSMRLSFKHAMETLAMIPPRSPRAANIPIALRFARSQLRGNEIVRKVCELVQAVNRARRDRYRELGKATSRAFYYEIVELDFSSVRLSASDLIHLRRLHPAPQLGRLRLVLDNVIGGTPSDIIAFGSILSSWFNPRLSTELDPEPEPENLTSTPPNPSLVAATAVSFNASAFSLYHVASLFSALSAGGNGGTSQLSLRGALQLCDTRFAWAWISYGVLRERSSSKLESLDLSRNALRLEDAEIVSQIINASDESTGAQLLYHLFTRNSSNFANPSPKKTMQKRKGRKRRDDNVDAKETKDKIPLQPWAHLRAGTRLTLLMPDKTVNLNLTSSIDVRVVGAVSTVEAVVLVPGYGFLVVNLADATPAEDIKAPRPTDHHLHELKLNSMAIPVETVHPNAVIEALFSCLSLGSLTTLELNGNPLAQGALRSILAACPALTSLSVEDCELQSISAIVEAYARGTCHLESLNLTENHLGDRDIVELCRLITHQDSPASHLRVLILHLNPITTRALHALSTAIRQSPRALMHLVLDKDQDPDAQFRPVFYPLDGQFLGPTPLSVAHQREFCAALARCLGTTALEPSLLSRILAYAASDVPRRIEWR